MRLYTNSARTINPRWRWRTAETIKMRLTLMACVYRKPYPDLSNGRIGLIGEMIADLLCPGRADLAIQVEEPA
jgi:hypothetical protein